MIRFSQIFLLGGLGVSSLALAGCNRRGEFSPVDMWNRSRYKPLEPTAQNVGPSTSRQLPPGTVYRGQTERDKLYPPSENGMSVRRMQNAGRMREESATPAQPGSAATTTTVIGNNGVAGRNGTAPAAGRAPSVTAGGRVITNPNRSMSGTGAGSMGTNNLGPTGDYRIRGGGATMTKFPFPVTKVVLQRGKERYEIYCTPCHGKTGAGDGMIVRRGFSAPPTYHQERLRKAPVGHFFDVITNGYGAMYPYADKVSPEDRWAITAYIRALQLSQNAKLSDVPQKERANIGKPKPFGSTPGHGEERSGDSGFDSSSTKPDAGGHDPSTSQ